VELRCPKILSTSLGFPIWSLRVSKFFGDYPLIAKEYDNLNAATSPWSTSPRSTYRMMCRVVGCHRKIRTLNLQQTKKVTSLLHSAVLLLFVKKAHQSPALFAEPLFILDIRNSSRDPAFVDHYRRLSTLRSRTLLTTLAIMTARGCELPRFGNPRKISSDVKPND